MTTLPMHKSSRSPVWLRITAFLSTKSKETQRTYSGVISEWCRFLGAEPATQESAVKILAATDLHAISYRKWLESRPGQRSRLEQKSALSREVILSKSQLRSEKKRDGTTDLQSNATIAKKLAALRRTYRMLIASGLGVSKNPFDPDKVPSPAKDSGRKRPTEMIDFAKVLEVVNQPDAVSEKGRRDRALLATLFGSGLRRSEVVAIRLGDVRRTSKGTMYLYLRSTKAQKDAEQVVPEWAASTIESVIKDRAQHGALSGDYLFISYTGQAGKTAVERPLSDSGLYKLFKNYCLLAGVVGHVSPHSARATAITKLLVDGVSHREVQEFSRHSSVSMVEAYDKRRFDVERNPGKGLTFDENEGNSK